MKMPILHEGEIMIHADTLTVGQVVDTVYSPDNKLAKFEQVLRLADGTRRRFRLLELTSAAPVTVEQFWQEAKFARAVRASPRERNPGDRASDAPKRIRL